MKRENRGSATLQGMNLIMSAFPFSKFPSYTPCVVAFQKVSLAYQTLSKPSSRRLYDVSGRSDLAAAFNEQNGPPSTDASGLGGDETLNSVLYSVFCEFLDGDFEMIRVLVNAMNESNPGLNLGGDAVDSIEGAFTKLRELMLGEYTKVFLRQSREASLSRSVLCSFLHLSFSCAAGKKYLTIIRFELIRLYEIQHSLRQLSYFDVFGRLRLTLQLARVTLSIPMAIDQAMKETAEDKTDDSSETTGTERSSEKRREAAHQDEEADDDGGEVSSSEEGDEDPSIVDAFGMRSEEDASDDDDGGPFRHKSSNSKASRARLRAAKRARVEEAKKARIEEQEQRALQKRGLLGPTAASLLKGVVKVLETSEAWVPGNNRRSGSDD
jgi:hypothetical protein